MLDREVKSFRIGLFLTFPMAFCVLLYHMKWITKLNEIIGRVMLCFDVMFILFICSISLRRREINSNCQCVFFFYFLQESIYTKDNRGYYITKAKKRPHPVHSFRHMNVSSSLTYTNVKSLHFTIMM